MAFNFGMIAEVRGAMGSFGFIIVILFLIIFDTITYLLKMLEEDYYAVYEMIQVVYKELMIMGFVSFCIVMLQSSNVFGSGHTISHAWMETIDLAHIVLFFSAIFFVIQATLLIILLIFLSKEYRRSHVKDTNIIIEEIRNLETKGHWFSKFCYNHKMIPGSSLKYNSEFKVQYHLFRDTFGLPVAFDFALYLTLCTEKYTLSILDISASQRIVLIFVILINLARIELMSYGNTSECVDHSSLNDLSANAVGFIPTHECVHELLMTFTCTGFALIAWSVFMLWLTRYYEVRLMKNAGVSKSHYKTYLRLKDRDINEAKRMYLKLNARRKKRRAKGLYLIFVTELKSAKSALEVIKENTVMHVSSNRRTDSGGVEWNNRNTLSLSSSKSIRNNKVLVSKMSSGGISGISSSNMDDEAKPQVQPRDSRIHTDISILPDNKKTQPQTQIQTQTQTQTMLDETQTQTLLDQVPVPVPIMESESITTTDKFADIFLFRSKKLFLRTVETTVMLNCMWLALWATNYATLAHETGPDEMQWHLLILIPVIIVMPILSMVVKTSAKLVAITSFDHDAFGQVLETAEEVTLLLRDLRESVLSKVALITDENRTPEEIIQELFDDIDMDGSGELTRLELRRFLRLLDVDFSNFKYNSIFNAIDQNKDGSISIDEFNKLLFGEEDEDEIEAMQKLTQLHDEYYAQQRKAGLNTFLSADRDRGRRTPGRHGVITALKRMSIDNTNIEVSNAANLVLQALRRPSGSSVIMESNSRRSSASSYAGGDGNGNDTYAGGRRRRYSGCSTSSSIADFSDWNNESQQQQQQGSNGNGNGGGGGCYKNNSIIKIEDAILETMKSMTEGVNDNDDIDNDDRNNDSNKRSVDGHNMNRAQSCLTEKREDD
eukprot:gene3494-6955_t